MKYCVTPLLALLIVSGYAQKKVRRFSNVINHPAINVFSPYISADNSALLFLSDDADDRKLTLFYATKKDAVNWAKPTPVSRYVVNNNLAFIHGFALSADGQEMYFTSLKEGGLGGFDLYVSAREGGRWGPPINLGKPVNSPAHEGAPSVDVTGATIYFMRCQNMTQQKAEGCSLWRSKKSPTTNLWGAPEALPDYINTGNSQAPRILADGETLLFSSDRLTNNQGKMDLYLTRFEEGLWSTPQPLAFANSEGDDRYVSASALGRYLLRDRPGTRSNEIVELLFPPSLKPTPCLHVKGSVKWPEGNLPPYVSVVDRNTGEQLYNKAVDEKGKFVVYLKRDRQYDVAIDPADATYTFYSRLYDLTEARVPASANMDVEIGPVQDGTVIDLGGISFAPYSATITPESERELKRLVRLVRANPQYTFFVDVMFDGYRSDSLQSDVDLTERALDTLHVTIEKYVAYKEDRAQNDSIAYAQQDDTLYGEEDAEAERAETQEEPATAYGEDVPSTEASSSRIAVTIDSVAVKTVYHNDRTARQAQAIVDQLTEKGIPAQQLRIHHEASTEALKTHRTPTTYIRLRVE